jgi:hypothetical protein
VYSQLTEIEADDRRRRVTDQFRAAQRRHRRLPYTHDERRRAAHPTPPSRLTRSGSLVPAEGGST